MFRARNTHQSGSLGAKLAVGFGVHRVSISSLQLCTDVYFGSTKACFGLKPVEQLLWWSVPLSLRQIYSAGCYGRSNAWFTGTLMVTLP
jgi:hypothetical protein